MSQFKVIVFAIFLLIGTNTLFSATGSISGIVVDKENNLPLPGAIIELKDAKLGVVSDAKGRFRLVNVPTGENNIEVRYIGFKTLNQKINIETNKTLSLRLELESGIVQGDEVFVIGDAIKGQAKALNQQRNNINITNIVSADQVGRFPDANVGDALKRIPGITIQNDQGEARFGLVRGTAARLNTVMVNGDRIPSAEAENREVQLDLIPADMISQIEVSKVLTPDMDADAIGGAINLTTRPPSRQRLSLTVGGLYNGLSEQIAPNFSLIAGDRFLNDKLGLVLSATVFDHQLGSDNIEAEWDTAENAAGEDVAFMTEFEQRVYQVRRIRRSFSLGTDYNFNANNRIYLNAIYNWRDDWENRYRLRVRDIDYDPDTGEATYERAVRQTKGGINNGRTDNARLEDQRVMNFGFGGEHLVANKLKFTWQGNYAEASEHRPNERYIDYLYEEEDAEGDRIAIPLSAGRYDISDTRFPIAIANNPNGELLNPGDFSLDAITEEEQDTKDIDFNIRFDFEIPVIETGDYTSKLKFGTRLRTKEKYRENNFFEYSPTDLGEALVDDLDIIQREDQSDPDYLAGEEYQAGEFATKEALGELNLQDETLFERESKLDEFAGGNFEATEEIQSSYLMYTQNVGSKLTLLGGLRLESTANSYTGRIYSEDDETLADVEKDRRESNYSNLLFNFQSKYAILDNFFARAAFTQSIARPNYFDLTPYQIIVPDDNEIEIGNPSLEPTKSNNFDILLDYYFENVGILSGGVFYKDITNFTFNYQDENNPEFNGVVYDALSQPRNGTEASLFGFEAAFQRQLDFLPSFLKNLSIYFNYTYTSSDATIEFGEEVDDDGNTIILTRDISLPGTAENMFNASLAYEDDLLTIRVAANYASDYIDELGSSAFNDRYYDEQFFLDINAAVNFYEGFRFFIEANNLTNQPLRYYQGTNDQTMQVEFYSYRINTGIKYDF